MAPGFIALGGVGSTPTPASDMESLWDGLEAVSELAMVLLLIALVVHLLWR
jgi:hypothetical protein